MASLSDPRLIFVDGGGLEGWLGLSPDIWLEAAEGQGAVDSTGTCENIGEDEVEVDDSVASGLLSGSAVSLLYASASGALEI